jgi:Flp pilus assembly CpaE family ATPase
VLRLLDLLEQQADVVVVDLPFNLFDCHAQTFAASDQVLLVAEQNVPSLRALGYAREKLAEVVRTLFGLSGPVRAGCAPCRRWGSRRGPSG